MAASPTRMVDHNCAARRTRLSDQKHRQLSRNLPETLGPFEVHTADCNLKQTTKQFSCDHMHTTFLLAVIAKLAELGICNRVNSEAY